MYNFAVFQNPLKNLLLNLYIFIQIFVCSVKKRKQSTSNNIICINVNPVEGCFKLTEPFQKVRIVKTLADPSCLRVPKPSKFSPKISYEMWITFIWDFYQEWVHYFCSGEGCVYLAYAWRRRVRCIHVGETFVYQVTTQSNHNWSTNTKRMDNDCLKRALSHKVISHRTAFPLLKTLFMAFMSDKKIFQYMHFDF